MLIIKNILYWLFILTFTANAGNVDLDLQVNLNPNSLVEFNEFGDFSITVTNNGPDSVAIGSNDPSPISVLSSNLHLGSDGFVDLSFSANTNQNCYVAIIALDPPPNGMLSYVYSFELPSIQANESFTCYGTYHIGFKQGQRSVNWRVRNNYDNDPDLTNNQTNDFVFGIKPQVIPSTTILSLFLLALFIIVIIYFKYLRGSDEKFNIH